MRLTFEDDFQQFDGSPDGPTKWMTKFAHEGPLGRTLNERAIYFYGDATTGHDPFSVTPSGLNIQADRTPNPLNLPYTSGVITTYRSFSQLYGYFEMRAQVPAGRGMFPAFWLLPHDRSWPPEIDVMEVLGRNPSKLYVTTLVKKDSQIITAQIPVETVDLSQGFHTYAVNWQPDAITWYLDDVRVGEQPTPVTMHKPMYMLVNLAIGGDWAGMPNDRTPFPGNYRIAYVRAYANVNPRSADGR